MMRRLFLASCVAGLLASSAAALDQVKLLTGKGVNGQVTEMTPLEVKVEQGQIPKSVPVNQIDYIAFEDEPKELTNARIKMRTGEYGAALALLKKVDIEAIKRREVKQDAEYYKAVVMARLALAGGGSLKEAGKALLDYEKANKGNYHYLEACETVGDLFVATGRYDKAEEYYAKVANAPWPDYKVRAGVLQGRALEAQKQWDKAIAKYDEVLAMSGESKDVEKQKLAAALGKATALAGSGKAEVAVKAVEDVIAKAEPENLELHARAYNALGNCYLAANKKKEALLAFLHVDVLYAAFPEQHAEALAKLATLWTQVDKAERATDARSTLQARYPNSRWTKKSAE